MGLIILKKKDSGFTLIEVMIALSVLLIGMLGIAAMLVTSIDANENNKRATEATYLAEQQLEIFRGTPFQSVVDMNSTDTAANTKINARGDQNQDASLPKLPCIYRRTWVITNASDTVKDIKVKVTWTYKNQQHEVVLASEKSA